MEIKTIDKLLEVMIVRYEQTINTYNVKKDKDTIALFGEELLNNLSDDVIQGMNRNNLLMQDILHIMKQYKTYDFSHLSDNFTSKVLIFFNTYFDLKKLCTDTFADDFILLRNMINGHIHLSYQYQESVPFGFKDSDKYLKRKLTKFKGLKKGTFWIDTRLSPYETLKFYGIQSKDLLPSASSFRNPYVKKREFNGYVNETVKEFMQIIITGNYDRQYKDKKIRFTAKSYNIYENEINFFEESLLNSKVIAKIGLLKKG